jgi:hypothetical protein
MPQYTYKVLVDKQTYARDMDLPTALLLTQALFDKWHSEANLAITIEREDNAVCEVMIEDKIEVTK